MTSASRTFERRIDALADVFAFVAEQGAAADVVRRADLVLEELFTNVVRHGGGTAPVAITIETVVDGLEITLDDPDADPFDVTQAPEVDTALPIDQRRPGGLGLHLIKRLVVSIDHRYIAADRHSRIRFRVIRASQPPGGDPAR